MCGILGYISKKKIDIDFIKQLNDSQYHRGPDDSGIWVNENKALGHRRLSIIDTSSAGRQPMSNEDDKIWLVYNGEIYNFQELREHRLKKIHRFKSNTDSEVLIHLYEEYGIDFINFLEGMFAFGIMDLNKNKLYLCRDRIGIKPLYYGWVADEFMFASELKPYYLMRGFKKEICREAIVQYLTLGYINAPLTIFNGIHKLAPGHYLEMDLSLEEKNIAPSRYWNVCDYAYNEQGLIGNPEDALDAIDSLLSDIVKKYLISDVPLGIFLSGGIDSSLIASYAHRFYKGKLKALSIGFEEQEYNEIEYAKVVAEKFGLDHIKTYFNISDLRNLPDPIALFDEPFADSSSYPTYLVSKIAREKVHTILSGDGGDELFCGYKRYFNCLATSRIQRIPPAIFELCRRCLPKYFRGYTYCTKLSARFPQNYFEFISYFFGSEMIEMLPPSLHDYYRQFRQDLLKRYLSGPRGISPMKRFQVFDLQWYLPGDILTKVDRCSMAVSLETRVPMLDHRLVELNFKINDSLKYDRIKGKTILRKILGRYFDNSFLNRPKMGFGIPLPHWFMNGSLDEDYFSAVDNVGDMLNRKYLTGLLELHKKGRVDLSSRLWNILVLGKWLAAKGRQ